MPPLPDLAALCAYPPGLNGSAVRFERPCGSGGDTATTNNNSSDPVPPCPSAARAHDRRRAAAEAAQEEEERPAPARRVTRSRAGRNGQPKSDGKCTLFQSINRSAMALCFFPWFPQQLSGNYFSDIFLRKIYVQGSILYGVRSLSLGSIRGIFVTLFLGPRHDRRCWRAKRCRRRVLNPPPRRNMHKHRIIHIFRPPYRSLENSGIIGRCRLIGTSWFRCRFEFRTSGSTPPLRSFLAYCLRK